MCPPSLSLSLPLPSSPSQADKQQEGQREIRVDIITVGEEQEQPSKPLKAPKKTGVGKSTAAGGKGKKYVKWTNAVFTILKCTFHSV